MIKAFLLGNLILVIGIGSFIAGVIFSNPIKIIIKDLIDTFKAIFGKIGGSGGGI